MHIAVTEPWPYGLPGNIKMATEMTTSVDEIDRNKQVELLKDHGLI